MNKKIDDMTKEEQYREYIKAHSNKEYVNAEEKYLKEANKRAVELARFERAKKRRPEFVGQAQRNSRKMEKDFQSREPKGKKKNTNKKMRLNKKKFAKRLIIFFAILFFIFASVFYSITRNFDRQDIGNKDYGITPYAAKEMRKYRNILILGADARQSQGYEGSRTDAIVILSINKRNGEMRLISIMRDSYLSMRGNGGGNYVLSKATHAHAYDGAMNTVSMLNRSLDLNIKEYVLFNWEAVSNMVDALGGVQIDVKEDEIQDLNKFGQETANNVGSTYNQITGAGVQTLDGAQAVTYCRIRETSGGDSSRGERYKKVIQAVISKGIKNPVALKRASNQVFPQIRTNMSQFDMMTATMRASGAKMGESVAWPKSYYGGILGDGVWYAVPTTLESNVKQLHKDAFGNDNYNPSDICLEINNQIISNTGIR